MCIEAAGTERCQTWHGSDENCYRIWTASRWHNRLRSIWNCLQGLLISALNVITVSSDNCGTIWQHLFRLNPLLITFHWELETFLYISSFSFHWVDLTPLPNKVEYILMLSKLSPHFSCPPLSLFQPIYRKEHFKYVMLNVLQQNCNASSLPLTTICYKERKFRK